MRLPSDPRTAVVGATGAVGRVMLELLEARAFPAQEVTAIASARSEGKRIPFRGSELSVKALTADSLTGLDLVLLDVPDEVAREWAPIAREAGALVIDNSAAWRMEEGVPLVVPEINPKDAEANDGIIASPNCTTIGVVVPLNALHLKFGLKSVVVSSYQATSGAGQPGVDELSDQALKMTDSVLQLAQPGAEQLAPAPQNFAIPIAFNLIPQIGSIGDKGFTSEEWKLLYESRKIMGLPTLEMVGTCVRVPTVAGHGSSVRATFDQAVSVERATEVLGRAPGVVLADLPNPLASVGKDGCFTGRIRQDPFDEHCLWFFTVSDNLRKGAALNAIQIAELLI